MGTRTFHCDQDSTVTETCDEDMKNKKLSTAILSFLPTLNAFLLKNALQLSQEMALKLYPSALSPHTRHSLSLAPRAF